MRLASRWSTARWPRKERGVERIVLLVNALPEHRFAGTLAADEMPAWRYGQALRAADEAVFYNRDDLGAAQALALVPGAVHDRRGRAPASTW